jgi:hypothetical protein
VFCVISSLIILNAARGFKYFIDPAPTLRVTTRHFERTDSVRHYWLEVDLGRQVVRMGESPLGSSGWAEVTSAVTFRRFLEGEGHDVIKRNFCDDIFEDVLTLVEGARK